MTTPTNALEVTRLDGTLAALDEPQLAELRTRLQGGLVRPGDDGFEQAVQLWNALAARRPALVVQPAVTTSRVPRSRPAG